MNNLTPSNSEFNPKIFGHNIKEARKRLNMPQKELADLVGISRHTLIDIESGKRDTSLAKVAKIARHLQTSLTELVILLPDNGLRLVVHESHEVSHANEGLAAFVELLQDHVASLEKTCADLREDISMLRQELNEVKMQASISQ